MRKGSSIVFLLVIFLLCSLLSSAVQLRAWMVGISNEQAKIIQDILEEDFTPKTGIEVLIDPLPWADSDRRMMLAAASGDAPDIALMSGLLAAELGIRGAMVDLKLEFGDDFASHIQDSFPNAFRTYEFQGRFLACLSRWQSLPCSTASTFFRRWALKNPKPGTMCGR